jgi:hypothetical protein
LITESESWEDFSKWNGMLAVSVLYVIYIWKGRSLSSMKDSLLSVPVSLQLKWILQQLAEDPTYTAKVLLLFTCSVFWIMLHKGWLRSLTFTMIIYGQMKILMQFDLTISDGSFPSTCRLEVYIWLLRGPSHFTGTH